MENQTNKEVEELKKRDWKKFLVETYGFPDDYELIKKSELEDFKRKKYLSVALTGMFILVGILCLSGVIFYSAYSDKFKSDLICGNMTSTCEGNTLTCPTIPSYTCPTCTNNCNCPEFPDNLELTIKNETN